MDKQTMSPEMKQALMQALLEQEQMAQINNQTQSGQSQFMAPVAGGMQDSAYNAALPGGYVQLNQKPNVTPQQFPAGAYGADGTPSGHAAYRPPIHSLMQKYFGAR